MPGLGVIDSASRVADDPRIARRRMKRPRTAHLSREGPTRAHSERLPRRQVELIGDCRRRDGTALEYLPADGVVLAVEADPGRPLDRDGDREGGEVGCVVQPYHLFVEPGTVVGYRRRNSHSASPGIAVHREAPGGRLL